MILIFNAHFVSIFSFKIAIVFWKFDCFFIVLNYRIVFELLNMYPYCKSKYIIVRTNFEGFHDDTRRKMKNLISMGCIEKV